jgi:hypothetical protein
LFVGTGVGRKQIGDGHFTSIIFDDTKVGLATVFADGVRPLHAKGGRDGWYFQNDWTSGSEHLPAGNVGKKKINWYFYDYGTVQATYTQFNYAYAVVTLESGQSPFFYMYTTVDGASIAATHVFSTPSETVTAGSYVIWFGDEAPPSTIYPALKRIRMTKSNTSVPIVGTHKVLTIAFTTNSAAPQNSIKLMTYQLGYNTDPDAKHFNLRMSSANTSVSGATYTHTQSTNSTTWDIVHNLGKRPSVTTVDELGNEIDGFVVWNSDNQVTVYFSPAAKGFAYLN